MHHMDHKLIYYCARYEALQIACTPGRAHSKEGSRHSFTALPVLEFLGLLITTSISVLIFPEWDHPTAEFHLSQLHRMLWRRQQVMPTDCTLDAIPRVIGKHNVSGRRQDGLLCCEGGVSAGACRPTGYDTHTPQSSGSARRHPKKHSQ